MLPAFIVAAIKIGVVLLGAGGATAGAHGVCQNKKKPSELVRMHRNGIIGQSQGFTVDATK